MTFKKIFRMLASGSRLGIDRPAKLLSLLLVFTLPVTTQATLSVVHVDAARPNDSGDGTSWATAKKTIQAAVNAVATSGTVLVTNGIYNTGSTVTPGGTLPNRVVATNAIVIRSVNGPAETIIQGQGPLGTNAVRGVYLSGGAQLIGFTVENGATRTTGNYLDNYAGGVSCQASVVSNCVIRNNFSGTDGGGVHLNLSGGIICNSIIESNKAAAKGGGIALTDATDGVGSVVRNCRIVGNLATTVGGGVFIWHPGTLQNCLIADNAATNSAGGVWVDSGNLGAGANIVNCTIAGNKAPSYGGLSFIYAGATIKNSIIWGNTGGNGNGGSYTYCATTPLPSGTGNTTNNPLFADSDYRLSAGSPCIDAGANSYVNGATDLDGNPRIANSRVDMGAYENGYYTLTVNDGSGSSNLYVTGQLVMIAADAPATGKAFDRWTGDTQYVASVTSATTTVTMPAQSVTLTAAYKDIYYTLTVNAGNGSGSSYIYQQNVDIAADAPAIGKAFDRWTGDTQYVASVTSSATTVTMPAQAVTLTATYKDVHYTLTVNDGSGSGSSYIYQQNVEIAADAPATGKAFDRWTGDTQYVASVTSSTTTVTMPVQAVTLTATYKSLYYPLTVNGGSGSASCTYQQQAAIAADAPATGMAFDRWTGDTDYVADATAANTTVTMPVQAVTLTATYKSLYYPLTVNGGSGSASCTYQQQAAIAADAPATGMAFDRWTGDTDYVADATAANTTVTMPVQAVTLTATYKSLYYPLTVNGGSGSASCTYQQQAAIAADAPATGMAFDRWTGDTDYVADATAANTTVTMPVQAVTLTATYKSLYYPLTVNGGSGSASCTYQQQAAIAADAPATGMAFDRWTGDTDYVADVTAANTTVTMPVQAVTLTATYVNVYPLTVNSGSGSGSYTNRHPVAIEADAPTTGMAFDWWIGDIEYVASITSETTTVTMPNRAVTLTAIYKTAYYPLTVQGGTGSGSCTNGQKVRIAATVPVGWKFYRWNDGDTNASRMITMPPHAALYIANLTDITKPVLTISSPANGMQSTNRTVMVTGKATDNDGGKDILVRLNSDDWILNNAFPGSTNWTANLTLQPGANTICAYARDAAGNCSLTSRIVCTYLVYSTLTLQTNGPGTVTRTPVGVPEVGKLYTLTATPKAGYGFINWTDGTGGFVSTNKVLKFTMTSNAVFTANFTDIQKPTVAITYPTASMRVTNAVCTVKGTAADNAAVTGVYCRVNSDIWIKADTTNNWKNWSIPLNLTAGSNLIQACSADADGNSSLTSRVVCTYVVYSTLTLQTNGLGTVTRAPAALPEVNKTYTLTAAPVAGYNFKNWTGDLAGTNKLTTFVMTTNMSITANFTDIQKPTVAITYPTASMRVTNAVCTIAGNAADNAAVTGVYCRVNNGTWINAVTTNGWKNWRVPLNLTAGSNLIQACSADAAGNSSLTSGVVCTYVVAANLTIQTNGAGTVARTPAGAPEIGKLYTLTATPKAGSAFAGWAGDATDTNKIIRFTMTSNAVFTANFTDIQRPVVKIVYPTASLRVMTNGTVVIRGTAADNGVLKEVKYQLYNGDWTNAVSTNIFKAWTAPYEPVAGLNTSKVYSVDMQDNSSITSTVVFTYIPGAVLTVQTNSSEQGTIAPSLNGKVLQIGTANTMTATANAGYVFTSWTYGLGGLVATNTKAIKFVMTNNLVLTANFRDSDGELPFDAVADILAASQTPIVVDGFPEDWTGIPRSMFSYSSMTQEVAVALDGNNIALLLNGCPFNTSDTVLVYFKLRLTYGTDDNRHTVDLWTSGSVLYAMVDGQVITGLEAVLLNGVLEVKIPVEQTPTQVIIEEVGGGMDLGNGTLKELFRITPHESSLSSTP